MAVLHGSTAVEDKSVRGAFCSGWYCAGLERPLIFCISWPQSKSPHVLSFSFSFSFFLVLFFFPFSPTFFFSLPLIFKSTHFSASRHVVSRRARSDAAPSRPLRRAAGHIAQRSKQASRAPGVIYMRCETLHPAANTCAAALSSDHPNNKPTRLPFFWSL